MRAAWYEEAGPADQVFRVGERPAPEPLPGEVAVRVRFTGINPSDWKRRAGWTPAKDVKPIAIGGIPHADGAGEIVATGEGVDPARLGERVWLWNAEHRGFGAAAQICAVPQERAVRLPDHVPLEVGACLGVPAVTAHFAVLADGPVQGRAVLVAGGAGAVGSYAIQFAAQAGGRVAATASTPEKAGIARALGASLVADHRSPDAAQQLLDFTGGAGFERIVEVDLGANLALDLAVIAPNGVIASYSSTARPEFLLPYYALARKGVTLRVVQAYSLTPAARAAAIADITRALERNMLTHRIAAIFPLEEIGRAHALAESGQAVGKVLVLVT